MNIRSFIIFTTKTLIIFKFIHRPPEYICRNALCISYVVIFNRLSSTNMQLYELSLQMPRIPHIIRCVPFNCETVASNMRSHEMWKNWKLLYTLLHVLVGIYIYIYVRFYCIATNYELSCNTITNYAMCLHNFISFLI